MTKIIEASNYGDYDDSHVEAYEGFIVETRIFPENYIPDWEMTEDEERELSVKLDKGELLWFRVEVTATLDNVKFETAHLGGCCYKNLKEFIDANGYHNDLKQQTVDEAIAFLTKWSLPITSYSLLGT